jgi:hypothetical protein
VSVTVEQLQRLQRALRPTDSWRREQLVGVRRAFAFHRVAGPIVLYTTAQEWLRKRPSRFDGIGPDNTWAFQTTTQATRLPGKW